MLEILIGTTHENKANLVDLVTENSKQPQLCLRMGQLDLDICSNIY